MKRILYHTGFSVIREPDLRHGRKNADLGQGFYLSDSDAFAGKWIRDLKDEAFVNRYELEDEGLEELRLERDAAWFSYLRTNRAGKSDRYPGADLITAPIANDTIYDVLGVATSGFLRDDLALRMLQTGPCFYQTVIKTERAAARLRWLDARPLTSEEIAAFRTTVEQEEAAYLTRIAALMEEDEAD